MYKKALEKSVWIYVAIGAVPIILLIAWAVFYIVPSMSDEKVDFNDTFEVTATVVSVETTEKGDTGVVYLDIINEEYIKFQIDDAQEYKNFEKIKALSKGEKITARMLKEEEFWLEEDNEYMFSEIFALETENEELISFEEYERNVDWRNVKSYLIYIPIALLAIAISALGIYKAKKIKIEPKPSRLVK